MYKKIIVFLVVSACATIVFLVMNWALSDLQRGAGAFFSIIIASLAFLGGLAFLSEEDKTKKNKCIKKE